MNTIYLVGIPWDSYSVSRTEVFTTYKSALEFIEECIAKENGPGRGLHIQKVNLKELNEKENK